MKFLCEISVVFVWRGLLTGFIQEIAVEKFTERGLTVHQEQGETVPMCITPLFQDIFNKDRERGKKDNAPSKILIFLSCLTGISLFFFFFCTTTCV